MLGTNKGRLVSHPDNDVWTSIVDVAQRSSVPRSDVMRQAAMARATTEETHPVSLEFVCEEAAVAKDQFSLTPKGCIGRRQAEW